MKVISPSVFWDTFYGYYFDTWGPIKCCICTAQNRYRFQTTINILWNLQKLGFMVTLVLPFFCLPLGLSPRPSVPMVWSWYGQPTADLALIAPMRWLPQAMVDPWVHIPRGPSPSGQNRLPWSVLFHLILTSYKFELNLNQSKLCVIIILNLHQKQIYMEGNKFLDWFSNCGKCIYDQLITNSHPILLCATLHFKGCWKLC